MTVNSRFATRPRIKVDPAMSRSDGGFTLIELLVVLVIIPMIIGAVAEAIIFTVANDASTSNRLSDSANAQVTSAYFVHDVQGATEITAPASSAVIKALTGTGPFSGTTPQLCNPLSLPGISLTNAMPLVGLYRPASVSPALPPLSIGYWLVGTGSSAQIIRYSCSVSATFTSTNPVAVVVADTPHGAPLTDAVKAVVDIEPSQFSSAAALNWTRTSSLTVVQTSLSLPPPTGMIDVDTLNGFTAGTINVMSSLGPQAVSCTGTGIDGVTGFPDFTGCTGGSGYVAAGNSVTQAGIASVQIAVSEPASSYHYNLLSAPRGGTASASLSGPGAATLLDLGGLKFNGEGSFTCGDGKKHKVCATGSVVVDGTSFDCGTGSIYSTGGIQAVNLPSPPTCGTTTVTPIQQPVPNPYSSTLTCFQTGPTLPSFPTTTPPAGVSPTGLDSSGYQVPGIYTTALSGTLEPGVYVLEGGTSGSIVQAANQPSDTYYNNPATGVHDDSAGILLYLPGSGVGYPPGCLTQPALLPTPSISLIGGPQIIVAPLDSEQSSYWFSGNTTLADVWVWQDASNAQPLTMKGNSAIATGAITGNPVTGVSPGAGLMYLPAATLITSNGSPTIETGRMIVGGLQLGGTPSITLTGN